MPKQKLTLDFNYAKSALCVRQTVAHRFGLPLDREFTWRFLTESICALDPALLPNEIEVRGLIRLGLRVADEARMFSVFLQALKLHHPEIIVWVTLRD